MKNYKKIRDDLFLIKESLNNTSNQTQTPTIINRILIADGSGSMWNDIDNVKRTVIKYSKEASPNDTISVGYFSSAGQFGWICKGANPQHAEALISKFQFPMCMTCYTEILDDTHNLISDLTPISEVFSLCFMSDGFPNQKVEGIFTAIDKIAPKLASSVLIGYGDWYGRELMSKMAKALGGTLVHSNNLDEFANQYKAFSEASVSSTPKIAFEAHDVVDGILASVGNGNVVSHSLEYNNTVLLPNSSEYVLYLSRVPVGEELTNADAEIYAMARTALQSGNYILSQDLLGVIGDVKFVDDVTNSFTISEFGTVENNLLKAVTDESVRFVRGQKPNYVPKDDAFCLLDLADLLLSDESVKFLPYHPAFSYKKTGKSKKQKEGFPKFNAPKDVEVPLNTFVWSSDKLNLGVQSKIWGTIELDDKAKNVQLNQLFSTYIWRNYSLVNDGKLNVSKLPLKDLSKQTLDVLRQNDVIESENDVVVLDLTRIPLINRKIANNYKDLDSVCELVLEEKTLQAKQKALGYYYKSLPESLRDQVDDLVRPTSFTDAQVEYLKAFGVKKDGSFSPETEKVESTDFYMVKEFTFSIKGMKSLPSVDDVLKKIDSETPQQLHSKVWQTQF